jgi:hypothetical protein
MAQFCRGQSRQIARLQILLLALALVLLSGICGKAQTLYERPVLRVFDRDKNWPEAYRDEAYGDQGYGVAFTDDGRLATSPYDGKVRLYDRGLQVGCHPGGAERPLPWAARLPAGRQGAGGRI